jgi:hypothetical protein
MTKEIWENGEKGAKIMEEYVKNIGLYYGLIETNKKRRRKPQMDKEKDNETKRTHK